MNQTKMPEPFGWLLDCLPGGGIAFQKDAPTEMQSLVNSTAAVFTTSQAEAYADARVKYALEEAAALCDRFADRDMHPVECAAAIRAMIPGQP